LVSKFSFKFNLYRYNEVEVLFRENSWAETMTESAMQETALHGEEFNPDNPWNRPPSAAAIVNAVTATLDADAALQRGGSMIDWRRLRGGGGCIS
jgi:hypothetical protein